MVDCEKISGRNPGISFWKVFNVIPVEISGLVFRNRTHCKEKVKSDFRDHSGKKHFRDLQLKIKTCIVQFGHLDETITQ